MNKQMVRTELESIHLVRTELESIQVVRTLTYMQVVYVGECIGSSNAIQNFSDTFKSIIYFRVNFLFTRSTYSK